MSRPGNRWWTWAGAGVGLGLLAFVLWRIDYPRLAQVLRGARPGYLAMVPAAILLEQFVRALKWRQILHPLREIGTLRLFGAIMAGYLGGMLIPFGGSPLLRSWLVARNERIPMSSVLATVAIDRFIDGVVFALLVAGVLAFAAVPDPSGNLRVALLVGAGTGLTFFTALLWLLARHKRGISDGSGGFQRLVARLPARMAPRARHVLSAFGEGIAWPVATWRRLSIVLASVLIKLIAATHLLWAGLAFDTLLRPIDYLVLLAMLGFLAVVTYVARIPAGFTVGAVFCLGLFGVGEEVSLAMALTAQVGSMLTVAMTGAFALWRSGVALAQLQGRQGSHHGRD